MKKLLLANLLLTLTIYCFAQNVFYDAVEVNKNLVVQTGATWSFKTDSVSAKKLAGILRNYVRSSIPNIDRLTAGQIFTIFKDNPFFGGQIIPLSTGNAFPVNAGFFSKAISSIGNLDVTSIADGLARFLIKRGREELNIAFFQRMKYFLDSNIEAKTLFPATAKFLGSIESYRYSEFLQSLREAFYKDISNLIVGLNQLIDLPKYQNLLKALPEIRVAIRSAKIISELSQTDSSMHPANLISHFASLKEWGEMNINLQSSWKVLDEISKSVRKIKVDTIRYIEVDTVRLGDDTISSLVVTKLDKNLIKIDTNKIFRTNVYRIDSIQKEKYDTVKMTDVAWIKFSDFNTNILSDPITLKIFLGLLYQKMDSISFRDFQRNTTNVQDFMRANQDNIYKLADLIENFLVLANDVEQSIKDIRNKKDKGLTNDDYYTYIEKAINVIDYGFKVANEVKEGIADDRYIVMARNANNLYKNIYTKNYNAAVMNGYLILEEVLIKPESALANKGIVLVDSSSVFHISEPVKNNFVAANDSVTVSKFFAKDSINHRSKLIEDILRYGNVMASIINADSPEDAEAAIEAAVLPAGSSSIKKNSSWNISLNAYIGGYFGRSVNSTDMIDGNSSKVGVTAPVGIAVSKGLGLYKKGKKAGSSRGALSIYASLIDVGAIAGYRLNDDSTALDQKVTLNDIFAPGAYLVYGVGFPFKWLSYVPLSVGYGVQYGSKLYNKKDGKLGISNQSRWQSNWFVAVDIPLANFWAKNYKKK